VIIDGLVNLVRVRRDDGSVGRGLSETATFFAQGGDPYIERGVDELYTVLDTAGVDRAVLVAEPPGPWRPNRLGLHAIPLDEAVTAAEASGRLGVLVAIRDIDDPIRVCRALRCAAQSDVVVGAIVSAALLEEPLTSPRLYPAYAELVEADLRLVCTVGVFGPPMASKYQYPLLVEEVCADFPELTVIAAHGGHPWESLMVRLMMKFPRLYYLTSAFRPKHLDPAILRYMSSSRGRDRVMFGSDWPMLDPATCIADARTLELTPDTLARYLGGNLARVLGWSPSA
jgi:hypothetical protein